ncbi:MAG: TetR/AcrR family transcriptional regulator [Gammaproteobacteria bacterium]|nr:TetR/AcrR family transcriptional regulator [Gammaproteobacteria bacterium]
MPKPRFQRRKEDRPQEITAAAFAAFAEKGYAATRVDEVAKRAGVSKGLLYLYFKTKEELFKAVVRSLVMPRVDALTASIDTTELSAEEFLRGPFLDFVKKLPGSPVSVVIRLLIAEGPKHPDLVQFYWDNVVSRGLATITELLERGVANGEFRRSAVNDMPHLVIMPVVFSVVFKLLFAEQTLDTDKLIETQLELLIAHMKGAAS